MLLQTILNHCYKFKSFVYKNIYFEEDSKNGQKLVVEIEPRLNGQALCTKCQKPSSRYGKMPNPRDFRFIPIWGIPVFFRYHRRRVNCPTHGVVAEWLPWAEGNSPLTIALKLYLASWAKYLSWQTVAELFHVTWANVFASVEYVVEFGLKHRCLDGIKAIGIDEIQYRLGHQYLTLVYQIDEGSRRLLYIAKDRSEESLRGFFERLGETRSQLVEVVCSDMWKPYLNVIAEMASNALNILDRFHIMKKFNEAIDNVRRKEARQLEEDGYEPILKNSRWLLLKNPANQKASQLAQLAELLKYNLKTVRAYLLKQAFQQFWEYTSTYWAEQFLQQWTKRAMYSRIDELKALARMLRTHQHLILNWFETKERLSNGIVEGFNNKAKLTMKKAYGFKQYKTLRIALYHQLGNLSTPELAHKFF
jgi:transposase